jgi:hypothetical protein
MEERSKVNGTIKRRRRLERPDMVAALQASSHFKSSEEGGKVSLKNWKCCEIYGMVPAGKAQART